MARLTIATGAPLGPSRDSKSRPAINGICIVAKIFADTLPNRLTGSCAAANVRPAIPNDVLGVLIVGIVDDHAAALIPGVE